MKKASNVKQVSLNELVFKTAAKTALVLLALLVFLSTLILLLAPKKASIFCMNMGMDGIAAWTAQTAAYKSGEFEDWYETMVLASKATKSKIAYNATSKMKEFEDYKGLIKKKDIPIKNSEGVVVSTFYADYYVQYIRALHGTLHFTESAHLKVVWNEAKNWVTIGNNRYYSTNPISGVIEALSRDKTINIEGVDVLAQLLDAYNKTGDFAEVDNYSYRKYIKFDALKYIQARNTEGSLDEQKKFWESKN